MYINNAIILSCNASDAELVEQFDKLTAHYVSSIAGCNMYKTQGITRVVLTTEGSSIIMTPQDKCKMILDQTLCGPKSAYELLGSSA